MHSCTQLFVYSFAFPLFLNSLPSTDRQWLESSPKSTLALRGGSRPSGSPHGACEFSGPGKDASGTPCFPGPDLQANFHGHELSLTEPPGTLSAPGTSQAFLTFSPAAPVASGLAPSEDPGSLLPSAHTAPPGPGGALTEPAAATHSFLSHNFLAMVPGHSGRHSPGLQAHGPTLPGQPPLPEKKRASEGDRSLGSVSPSSSGFSSPHSGSTISIPFPSVLPDFSRPPETVSPLPGGCPTAYMLGRGAPALLPSWLAAGLPLQAQVCCTHCTPESAPAGCPLLPASHLPGFPPSSLTSPQERKAWAFARAPGFPLLLGPNPGKSLLV